MAAPLRPIMLVRPPNAILYEESFWDELQHAGINEVALQWLCLLDDRGNEGNRYPQVEDSHQRGLAAVGGSPVRRVPVSPYPPTQKLYEGLEWRPPEMPSHLAGDAQRLREALQLGVAKGFKIYVTDDKGYFLAGSFGTGRLNPSAPRWSFANPEGPSMTVARARDMAAHFPEVSGILLDGPDFKWEIAPGHRDDMWVEVIDDDHMIRLAERNGFTMQQILAGRDRLYELLHGLTTHGVEELVERYEGKPGGFTRWIDDDEILGFFRFRAAVIEWNLCSSYAGIKTHLPKLLVGSSSRMPALAPLTGHDLAHKRAYCDFQMPKEYWWAGGVAGMRGTLQNWVKTLVDWNPGLAPELAEQWVSVAMDIPVPADYPVSTYDGEATDRWFATSVRDQTMKMLAASGGPDRFVPWVGLEHFGSNWLTPSELRRLLAEMQAQGATRYCYFVYNSVKPEIWDVITSFSRG